MAPVALPASLASALVCESLQPDHMMTSAGDVLVCLVFSAASELLPMRDFPRLLESAMPDGALCWDQNSPHDALEHSARVTPGKSAFVHQREKLSEDVPKVAHTGTK